MLKIPRSLWVFIWLGAVGLLLWGIFDGRPHHGFFGESDKVDHAVAFAVVTLLGLRLGVWAPVWISLPVWLVLAFGLEYLQGAWAVQRTFDMGDAWANAAGVVLAYVIALGTSVYIRFVTVARP